MDVTRWRYHKPGITALKHFPSTRGKNNTTFKFLVHNSSHVPSPVSGSFKLNVFPLFPPPTIPAYFLFLLGNVYTAAAPLFHCSRAPAHGQRSANTLCPQNVSRYETKTSRQLCTVYSPSETIPTNSFGISKEYKNSEAIPPPPPPPTHSPQLISRSPLSPLVHLPCAYPPPPHPPNKVQGRCSKHHHPLKLR